MSKLLSFMFTKKSLFIIIVLVLGSSVFFAVRSSSHKTPVNRYEKVLALIGEMLEDGHFSPKKIDDNFSKEVMTRFLKSLDPDKIYFLASDIEQFKKFEKRIDDEIHGAKLESFYLINEVFKKRVSEVAVYYKEILKSPFDFNTDETYIDESDNLPYPKNEAARKEAWRKKLKFHTLEKYVELIEQQEKNKIREQPALSKQEMEKQAREKVAKIYDRMFDRFRNRFMDDDRFNLFVNDITETMDPHTTYFPPIEKRSFDEQMSGEFYGIGATLMEEDGNIKIGSVVTGSPASKSGEIRAGDYIQKVAQGTEEPQDLSGFSVEDAVRIIRGKKGTEVQLTIKKADGTIKVISLIREKINLDDTYAKSLIIQGPDNYKIGYIYLPEFYANFNDPNGARCANDVAKEIIKLKIEKVSGIILDLRTNGGGSLMDVVQMVGLFIEDGPVVQVKSRDEIPTILRDRDNNILWNGPLTVMVNEFSASASEIFAAAIQDYKRGLVIGSTSTYGKGTVQRSIELERNTWSTSEPIDLGSLKLTLQKFYRISGGSTQLKGVVPDIILPDQYEYLQYREKDDPAALGWDEINSTQYKIWNSEYNLSEVIQRTNDRIRQNSSFQKIKEHTDWLSKNNQKVYSLKLDQYRKEKKALSETVRQIDTLTKLPAALNIVNLKDDLVRIEQDSLKKERNNLFLKIRKNDLHLGETVNIMYDMIQQYYIALNKQAGRSQE
jgi:carboxyl-terminal processing protease